MQTQLWLGGYIHACTNETHPLANLQNLIPTLAAIMMYRQHKTSLKSCRCARELVSFVHAQM